LSQNGTPVVALLVSLKMFYFHAGQPLPPMDEEWSNLPPHSLHRLLWSVLQPVCACWFSLGTKLSGQWHIH
jgi:hypothetical protein